jgi:N-acetyl sugar amidotransferase
MERPYQICTRCVMDTTNPDIIFDENGICNHCHEYDNNVKPLIFARNDGERKLNELAEDIKRKGRGKKYDCVAGVSGGVDSTYAIYIAKNLGLRPLAVQLDNGWDTETATRNVERTLKKLDIDLFKYTIEWDEFRDLQLAYLKASVVDIEAITDHAIHAILFRTADERGVKYIITGVNFSTESIRIDSWVHPKNDVTNIRDIHNTFGKVKLRIFPAMGIVKHAYYQGIKGIKMVSVLNYMPYVWEEAKKTIVRELDWEDYGAKHRESIWTRFYQGYILPVKFNIDKRKAHLSNLIHSGQLSREEALLELQKPPYTEEELNKDKAYCFKKLGLSEDEFENIMKMPVKSHYDYKTDRLWRKPVMSVYKLLGGVKY